jgi:alginate O-acetyltransferase complex protein AlgI
VLFVIAILASMPLLRWLKTRLDGRVMVQRAAVPVVYAVLLVVSYAYLLDSSFNPFLYFRF